MAFDWAEMQELPAVEVLIVARCGREGRICAHDLSIEGDEQRARWVPDVQRAGGCSCDPAPKLPEGGELERYVARAKRNLGAPHRAGLSALTIRVR